MILTGRNIVVTGSSTGLGYAIATAYVAEGANVALCGRDSAALSAAAGRLKEAVAPGRSILAVPCDVADEAQVKELVERSLDAFGTLDVLVNNAGTLGPIGKSDQVDPAEWRTAFETNIFGVLHCCQAVLPHFRSRGSGKIINLSGGGATSPRPFFSAYAASKAAVVRFTENLAEELSGTAIYVNAVAPGALNTRMLEEVLAAGPERNGDTQFQQALRQKHEGGSSLDRAADLCVYLASDAANGITGRLISAPWDPWEGLHTRLAELQSTDIYTLRRIIPSDRGRVWQ